MMQALRHCGFPRPSRSLCREGAYHHQQRQENVGLNSVGRCGRMNWVCMWIRASTVASAGPILIACPINNAATIPRTFASLQRSAIRSQGRKIPRTIACSEAFCRSRFEFSLGPDRKEESRVDETRAAGAAVDGETGDRCAIRAVARDGLILSLIPAQASTPRRCGVRVALELGC